MGRCSGWLAAIGAVGLGAGLPGCGAKSGRSAKADDAPKAVPVTVIPVERRQVKRSVEVVGSFKGWDEVTLGAKKAGRVVRVLHDIGDRVAPGDLLVEVDPTDADLAVVKAEKTLLADLAKLGLTSLPGKSFEVEKVPAVAQARVALEKFAREHNRQRTLYQKNATTLQDLQNAETDERGGEASLAAAVITAQSNLAAAQSSKASLDAAIQTRRDVEIRVPTPTSTPDGYAAPAGYAITKRSVHEGQWLKEGEAVADLVIADALRVWANVPERFTPEVAVGQAARVRVAAFPGEEFPGRVSRINPSVDPVSRTFQVEVTVPNRAGKLRPGGFAKASIITRRESDALVVPLESVVRFAGVTKVFVVRDEKAREVRAETGLEGRDWIEILGPLSPGDRVVTSGWTQLAEGTPVVLRKVEAPAPGPVVAPAKAGG